MYFLGRTFLIVNNRNRLWRQKVQTLLFIFTSRFSLLNNQYKLNDIIILHKYKFSGFRMSGQNKKAFFQGKLDRFNGITIHSEKEPCPIENLAKNLQDSIEIWKEKEHKGIWFNVHLDHADWVPVLAKAGFRFHHAKDDRVMMYLWLPKEPCNIPYYAHTLIGVGAVVVNDKSQILVVSEKHYDFPHWKLPGGYVEPGENLVDAAIREVHEETNINTEFRSMLTFRHGHHGMFDCSDIYFVVGLKPNTGEIAKCNREIADSKWMDIDEYLEHPHVHELNRFFLQKYLEHEEHNIKIDCHHNIHQRLQVPYTVYHVTRNGKNETKEPGKE